MPNPVVESLDENEAWDDKNDALLEGLVYAKRRFYAQALSAFSIFGSVLSKNGSVVLDGFSNASIRFDASQLNRAFNSASLRFQELGLQTSPRTSPTRYPI